MTKKGLAAAHGLRSPGDPGGAGPRLLFVCPGCGPSCFWRCWGSSSSHCGCCFSAVPRCGLWSPCRQGRISPQARTPEETQVSQTFGNLQVQITRQVREEYPNARWVWKTPQAREKLRRGEEAAILLNRAGGYREASVLPLEGGKVEVRYLLPPEVPAAQEAVSQMEAAPVAPGTCSGGPQPFRL